MISRRRFLGQCSGCAVGLAIGADMLGEESRAQVLVSGGPDVDRWTRGVCDLCGLAEPVFVGTRDGRLAAVKGIPQSRIGFGRLCPRAQAIVGAAGTEDRATEPLLRRDPSTKGTLEGFEAVSWEEALASVAAGFASARDTLGPEGIAFLASDAETCETYSVLGRFARAGLGTDHLDTPAGLDARHAYDACEQVYGLAANPGCVEDVDAAQLLVLVGGDIAESHPALYYRVLDARRNDRARVVLVDARRTLAAAVADLHLRPRPGGELAVVNALARALLPDPEGRGEDASAWLSWLESKPAAANGSAVLAKAGVPASDIQALADLWRNTARNVTVIGPTALGTPSGSALARATAQLHRATGRWGGPGRGALFLPRGGNATGAVALGIAPGRLPAGRRLSTGEDRVATARAWGVEADALPPQPGRTALEWPALVKAGKLRALFAHRVNVAAEMPNALAWRQALTDAFTVATATHVPTETTVFADVVLPLALSSGESSGTAMSLDRRCLSLEPAAGSPGQAKAAEPLLTEVARATLGAESFARLFPPTRTEWDVWRVLAQDTRFEARGISGARLRGELEIPFPCAAEDAPGTVRIGREDAPAGKYLATPSPLDGPATDAERPFLLVTGPLREHHRSRSRTGRTAELHYEAPYAQLEMHPEDGAALGLAGGDWVTLSSSVGSATARLWLTDRTIPGVVFLPEHYGFLSDVQGGSVTQKEPEGLAHRLTSCDLVEGVDAPAGLLAAVSVRKARRRDMRQRGI